MGESLLDAIKAESVSMSSWTGRAVIGSEDTAKIVEALRL